MEERNTNETLFQNSRLAGWEQNRRFYAGDHWQNSRGYMGQLPPLASSKFYKIVSDIETGFVSENAVKEVIDAHLDGFKNPDWQILRNAGEKLPAEIDNALIAHWDAMQLPQLAKHVGRKVLTEEIALVRMFVPPGYRDAEGNLSETDTFADALKYAHFEVVDREKGGVYRDSSKLQPFSVYRYSRRIGRRDVEFAEVSFTDDDDLTHLVTFKDVRGASEPEEYLDAARANLAQDFSMLSPSALRLVKKIADASDPIDLNGHLYLCEVRREEFITEQIRSLQKMINLARTMGGKNINIAGVRHRDYFNAKKPDTLATGGAANFLHGVPIKDDSGKTIGMTSPNVSVTDPSDPDYFIKTRNDAYAAILGQTGQRFRLMAGDATASGVSRTEARAEFVSTLNTTAFALDPFGRWMLEVALYFAAAFSNTDVSGYRADYRTTIKTGGADTETRKLDQMDVKDGLLDRETYITRNISDDAAAIQARLNAGTNDAVNEGTNSGA